MTKLLLLIVLGLTGCSSDRSIIDDKFTGAVEMENPFEPEPAPVLMSIRNVLTGGIISNPAGIEFNANNWVIVEVKTSSLDMISAPGGYVQIKNPDGNECLAIINGRLVLGSSCQKNNRSMLFTFLTSDTGAVQIQSASEKLCLGNGDGITDFRLMKCINDLARPYDLVPPGLLWMLNPPLSPASISPPII